MLFPNHATVTALSSLHAPRLCQNSVPAAGFKPEANLSYRRSNFSYGGGINSSNRCGYSNFACHRWSLEKLVFHAAYGSRGRIVRSVGSQLTNRGQLKPSSSQPCQAIVCCVRALRPGAHLAQEPLTPVDHLTREGQNFLVIISDNGR